MRTINLSRPIIEALYDEALMLADDVRAAFAGSIEADGSPGRPRDAMARLALSSEGLKTTTRMMHVLAWLLNQRAFFSGELSEKQVRLHGSLPPDRASDAEQLELIDAETRALILESEALHRRIARLDAAWRQDFEMDSPARAFQARIGREFGGL
jgi:regulator of CtrA degradation